MVFGEGAQVVNYGQMFSENFTVYCERTIQLKGSSARLFLGYGNSDSGFSFLNYSPLTVSQFTNKATLESSAKVSLPPDAVYGTGKTFFNGNVTLEIDKPNTRGFAWEKYKKEESKYYIPELLPIDRN